MFTCRKARSVRVYEDDETRREAVRKQRREAQQRHRMRKKAACFENLSTQVIVDILVCTTEYEADAFCYASRKTHLASQSAIVLLRRNVTYAVFSELPDRTAVARVGRSIWGLPSWWCKQYVSVPEKKYFSVSSNPHRVAMCPSSYPSHSAIHHHCSLNA